MWNRSETMQNTIEVGNPHGESVNTFTLHEATDLKTREGSKEGRVFIDNEYAGEYVQYAVMLGGVDLTLSSASPSTITMHNVAEVDTGKILGNGQLFLGKEYAGLDVTVGVRILAGPDSIGEAQSSNRTKTKANS
jgi:hypothetical protein